MPTLPTPEDLAKKILEICVYTYKAKPGDSVPVKSIALALVKEESSAADLEPGVLHAADLGWLELPKGAESSSVVVTADGYQAV